MTLTPVTSLPINKRYGPRNDLQTIVEQFADSNFEIARVDYEVTEYVNANILYACLWNALKHSNRPIKVRMVNNEVYLLKR